MFTRHWGRGGGHRAKASGGVQRPGGATTAPHGWIARVPLELVRNQSPPRLRHIQSTLSAVPSAQGSRSQRRHTSTCDLLTASCAYAATRLARAPSPRRRRAAGLCWTRPGRSPAATTLVFFLFPLFNSTTLLVGTKLRLSRAARRAYRSLLWRASRTRSCGTDPLGRSLPARPSARPPSAEPCQRCYSRLGPAEADPTHRQRRPNRHAPRFNESRPQRQPAKPAH